MNSPTKRSSNGWILWAETEKFRLDKTIIELRGTCATCAAA